MKAMSYAGFAAAGLALAPVLLPHVIPGITVDLAAGNSINLCSSGLASGLAADAAGVLSHVPFIGAELAAGGLMTVGVSAVISFGGLWLANYVDRHTPEGKFHWGRVIRWASLATSVLVGLPAILPAISMGINFLSQWLNLPAGVPELNSIADSIGKLGSSSAYSGANMALSGAGVGILHTLTCALPLGLTGYFFNKGHHDAKQVPDATLANTRQHQGMMQMPSMQMAIA